MNAKGGKDKVFDDGGNVTLHGGAGADHIEGATGANAVFGDADSDWLSVANNDFNDFVSGGDGFDTCVVDYELSDSGGPDIHDEWSSSCEIVRRVEID